MDCTGIAMEDYLAWMAEKGSSRSVARRLAATSTLTLKNLWEASTRDPRTFYEDSKVGEAYIGNLTQWHASRSIDSWFENVKKHLEPLQGSQGRYYPYVLDFGAGIGTYSLMAAEEGCLVESCEVNENLREYILWRVKRHGLNIFVSSKPEDIKYDMILCIDVVEHMADPPVFIAQLADLLKPSGRLLLTHTFHKSEGMHPMHHGPEAMPEFIVAVMKYFRPANDRGWPMVFERR